MSSNLLALLVIIVYVVILFVFAYLARARQKKIEQEKGADAESFLLASRSFGKYLVMFTLIGSAIGANGTVGIAQNGYKFGISAGWYDGAFGIGIVFTALLFIKKLRRLNITTVTEVYGNYYGESTRSIVAVGQIFMIYTIMVAQFIAGGAVLNSLMPEIFSFNGGMIVSAILFISIALIGGLSSAGITNIVNIIFLYVSIAVAVVFAVNQAGGMSTMINNLPDKALFLHPTKGLSVGILTSYLALFFVNVPTGTATIQMAFSAKDEKSAYWGYMLAGLAVLPFGFFTALLGMAAANIFPGLENSASALPMIVTTFPPLVTGFVLAGLWAAIISSATTYILGGAALFVNDVYRPLVKGPKDGLKEIKISKIAGLVFALVSLFTAFYVNSLLKFTTMGLSLSVGYFIILVTSLYAPQMCRKSSANVVFIVSFIDIFLWYLVPSISAVLPHVVFLHLIVCPIAFVLTMALDKRPAFFQTDLYEEKYGRKAAVLQ
jgi:SSS family solute:Na+ symporter